MSENVKPRCPRTLALNAKDASVDEWQGLACDLEIQLSDALKALEASNDAFCSTLMALKMKMGESDPEKLESFVENHWAVKQARVVLERAKK